MDKQKTHVAEYGNHDPTTGKEPDHGVTPCDWSGRQTWFNLDEVEERKGRKYLLCGCGNFVLIRNFRLNMH